MKFSYSLVKKLVPALKSKRDLIEKLNLYSFETEDAKGDVFDVSIPPNRFSDAASHWGIAAEISAIYGRNFQIPISIRQPADQFPNKLQISKSKIQNFAVKIQDKNLCSRYAAQYFENIKIKSSPKWMQKILIDCGLRPINNVVDIMNYAMLETGQPLHAFDYDKLSRSENRKAQIVVRRAKKPARNASHSDAGGGEKITTLDNQTLELNENILIIADDEKPLAIAGIKGGKKAEVDKNTKRIIVEAANFDAVNIYKSSRALKLSTDASSRFSHNLSSELTLFGLNRAGELLKEIVGAKAGQAADINFTKPIKKIIKFDLEKFNKFIGLDLDIKTVQNYLNRLGFSVKGGKTSRQSFLVEVSSLRGDIETFEDLAEEVGRLYGYNRLKSMPPKVYLTPSGFEDQIVLKDKIRKILAGTGLSEVYNYSFVDKGDENAVELENPISVQFKYLRSSLAPYLMKNIESNFRFFDEVRIFEIGKVFGSDPKLRISSESTNAANIFEKLKLGIALASQNKKDGQVFFELKGIVEQLFKKTGLVDYLMKESENGLEIKSDNRVVGFIRHFNNDNGALSEIDLEVLLKLIIEEHEYRPLPKYPSMIRDISILVGPSARVGEITQTIQEVDLKYIEDADLIDEYEIENKRSLAFRIIFQADDRTLTDSEVNEKMNKISETLKKKFGAVIR